MAQQAPRRTSETSSEEGHVSSWKRSRGVKIASSVGIVAGLTAGSFLVAGAATGGSGSPHESSSEAGHTRTMPAAFGTVASVGANSFTITTKAGATDTVNVSSSTTYRDRGVTTPSLANVIVGESVAVFGTLNSGVVTATSVAIGTPGGWGGHFGGESASRGSIN